MNIDLFVVNDRISATATVNSSALSLAHSYMCPNNRSPPKSRNHSISRTGRQSIDCCSRSQDSVSYDNYIYQQQEEEEPVDIAVAEYSADDSMDSVESAESETDPTLGVSDEAVDAQTHRPLDDDMIGNVWVQVVHQLDAMQLMIYPDSDITTQFVDVSGYFGKNSKDQVWNAYATRFYSQLAVINKTITYWQSLLFAHFNEWTLVLSHQVEPGPATDFKKPHFPTRQCCCLDPLNVNNGLHFCYAYWVKMQRVAALTYNYLTRYFMGGSTIQNFTKVVRLTAYKDYANNQYYEQHHTSMIGSLCLELNRLRAVCKYDLLFPVKLEDQLYNRLNMVNIVEYASSWGVLTTQYNKLSPLIPATKLASIALLGDMNISTYQLAVQTSTDAISACLNKKKLLDKQREYKAKATANLVKIVLNNVCLPMSCMEELISGVLWRNNLAWRTTGYIEYVDLLLDKLALYFLGPRTGVIMDDISFRAKYTIDSDFKETLKSTFTTILSQYEALEEPDPSLDSLSSISLNSSSDDDDFNNSGHSGHGVIPDSTGVMSDDVDTLVTPENIIINIDDDDTEASRCQPEWNTPALHTQSKQAEYQQQCEHLRSLAIQVDAGLTATVLTSDNGDSFTANSHFARYAAHTMSELLMTRFYHMKYIHVPWKFTGQTPEEIHFKMNYMVTVRQFIKYWTHFRLVSPPEMLRDSAEVKYKSCIINDCEINWYKYYAAFISKLPNGLISTTNTKLLEVLRPYEKKNIIDQAGEELADMFEGNRTDGLHRGFADWLRLLLGGSIFASTLIEFTGDNSKYILQQNQTISNEEWFKQVNFPFMWYNGGRYHVYYNGAIHYAFNLPCDLATRMREQLKLYPDKCVKSTVPFLNNSSSEDVSAFKTYLRKEHQAVCSTNLFMDNHFYMGANLYTLQHAVRSTLEAVEQQQQQPAKLAEACVSKYTWFYDNLRLCNIDSDSEHDTGECDNENDGDNHNECDHHTYPIDQLPADPFYRSLVSQGAELLRESREQFIDTQTSMPLDDGDTFYDTLALWVIITQDNHAHNPTLAKAVRMGIIDTCAILLKMAETNTQQDVNLIQATQFFSYVKEMTQTYERQYI